MGKGNYSHNPLRNTQILVPQHFGTEQLASGFTPEKFPHVSASERDELVRVGAIEPLGESGRIWRFKQQAPVLRGFSARYGEVLAVERDRMWWEMWWHEHRDRDYGEFMQFVEVFLSQIRRYAPRKATKPEGWVSNAIRPFHVVKPEPIELAL